MLFCLGSVLRLTPHCHIPLPPQPVPLRGRHIICSVILIWGTTRGSIFHLIISRTQTSQRFVHVWCKDSANSVSNIPCTFVGYRLATKSLNLSSTTGLPSWECACILTSLYIPWFLHGELTYRTHITIASASFHWLHIRNVIWFTLNTLYSCKDSALY